MLQRETAPRMKIAVKNYPLLGHYLSQCMVRGDASMAREFWEVPTLCRSQELDCDSKFYVRRNWRDAHVLCWKGFPQCHLFPRNCRFYHRKNFKTWNVPRKKKVRLKRNDPHMSPTLVPPEEISRDNIGTPGSEISWYFWWCFYVDVRPC